MPFDMTPDEEAREAAYWLLKAPLEFADSNSADLLSASEQHEFSRILTKLRQMAQVNVEKIK